MKVTTVRYPLLNPQTEIRIEVNYGTSVHISILELLGTTMKWNTFTTVWTRTVNMGFQLFPSQMFIRSRIQKIEQGDPGETMYGTPLSPHTHAMLHGLIRKLQVFSFLNYCHTQIIFIQNQKTQQCISVKLIFLVFLYNASLFPLIKIEMRRESLNNGKEKE